MIVRFNGKKFKFRACDTKNVTQEELQKLVNEIGYMQYDTYGMRVEPHLVVHGIGYGCETNKYEINEYDVAYAYAGIDQYTVYKNGEEIGTCWDIKTVAKWTETDVETVKEEMWKQR